MQNRKSKVLVFGTFDGIHPGHMHFLNEARKLGELYVSVASDESVLKRKKKLPQRKTKQRIADIAALQMAKNVFAGDIELGQWRDLRKIQPDIIALGYDQKALEKALRQAKKDLGLKFSIKKISSHKPRKFHSSLLSRTHLTKNV